MQWDNAMRRAEQLARQTKHRWYVRGWRGFDGKWYYGFWNNPQPEQLIERDWSEYGR